MDEKPNESIDMYRRVALDHTELLTRVSRLEDRAQIHMCTIVANFLMVVLVGLYIGIRLPWQ